MYVFQCFKCVCFVRYLLLLSFLFPFLGIIPLSVFDLFWHFSEPFVFLCMCFSVLSVCVFCVLASCAASALFSPQPCLSTVATFCKVWSQSFTRRLSTTSRAPIGVKWQLEAIHNNTYILYTIDWQTRFNASLYFALLAVSYGRDHNHQEHKSEWAKYRQESQYSNF